MSNKFKKIQENAKNYNMNEIYRNMTPEQYKKAVDYAVSKTRLDMANFYEKEFRKLYDDLNNEYHKEILEVIDTMSIELVYELAIQMNAFEEDDEWRKGQIIDRVQEIYSNVMTAIKQYSKINKRDAEKQYEEKKKKVQKMFNLKF